PTPITNAAGCAATMPDVAVSSTSDRPKVTPTCGGPRDVRVMSFNLRCPTIFDGLNYWPLRKQNLVQTIRAFEPDVLGTQECVAEQADYLKEQLPDYEF